jgi:hypothetical protein
MGYLKRLMAEEGFSWTEVAHLAGDRDGVPVEYVGFKVTNRRCRALACPARDRQGLSRYG